MALKLTKLVGLKKEEFDLLVKQPVMQVLLLF